MFIDIHNHTLFGVDDGPEELDIATALLQEAKDQGADAIILTPHYRRGMFAYPVEVIDAHFKQLEKVAGNIGIQLFLGCEYHVNSDIVKNLQAGRCKTLAGSDYVLTEYSYQTEYSYIEEQTHRLLSCGYISVIAHVERYQCFQKKPALCAELSNMGALIQINADSVLGMGGFKEKQTCKKLLKQGWADIVASDTHDLQERANHMQLCKTNIEKKYGNEYAEILFVKNPMRILNNR